MWTITENLYSIVNFKIKNVKYFVNHCKRQKNIRIQKYKLCALFVNHCELLWTPELEKII